MSLEFWQRVKEVFDAAWEREPQEREAYLTVACGNDAAVREEVRQLLLTQADEFLEKPLWFSPGMLPVGEQVGKVVGAYRLVRELGRGGMGAVYLAVRTTDGHEQTSEESSQREVAIKLVWPGLDATDIGRRFRQERQILAQLNHANITKLLDGGVTEDGWPYVVLEYVAGAPITAYCEENKLSLAERLKLFCAVCEAVEHAHEHQVIHRDLKPDNIFVTKEGAVKLLDFGVAELINPDHQTRALSLTGSGWQLMTPEYASPEQICGDEITVASDVYGLGLVLYELLTGHRPYRFKSPALRELVRVICEEEPERPSRVIFRVITVPTYEGEAEITHSPELVSQTREGSPELLRQGLTGDLDKIALMALRKDPLERYQSVAQLRADIERRLEHQPVLACEYTLLQRALKYFQRHKEEAVLTVLALFGIAVGILAAVIKKPD